MSDLGTLFAWLVVGLGFAGLVLIAWRIANNDMKFRHREREKKMEQEIPEVNEK